MAAVDSSVFDIHLLNFPDGMGKFVFPSRSNETHENKGVSSIPADILETPKHYTFFMDVPGLSKSDIQVFHQSSSHIPIILNFHSVNSH